MAVKQEGMCQSHHVYSNKKKKRKLCEEIWKFTKTFLVELIRLFDGKVCVFICKHLFSESVCGSVFTSSREEEEDIEAVEIAGLSVVELGITSGF